MLETFLTKPLNLTTDLGLLHNRNYGRAGAQTKGRRFLK